MYCCDKNGTFTVLSSDYGSFDPLDEKIKIPKTEGKEQQQIVIFNNLKEIVGCSLEEETGEINWYASRG